MRRPPKDSSPKLTSEGQRLISLSQAMVQVGSRVEERSLEQQLDQILQRLLKTNHQDTIDNALNNLFKDDLPAYDVLMEAVEAVSESSFMVELENDVEQRYSTLLIAAPVLAWTRFSIPQGPIPADLLSTLSAHFAAHLLADGVRLAMAPHLFSIDQLPRSHGDLYALTHKLAQAAFKNLPVKLQLKAPETVPFLADTRYLLVAVVVPFGAPIFRWQEQTHLNHFQATRETALEQWRVQAAPNVSRLLPGCGIELLLPEAYYVACREADKLIRPVSIRAAVHYLTNSLGCEPSELRAVIAGFGEEASEAQVDEYRVAFTMRQSTDVVYGIVWPLYGQEDEDGTPVEGLMNVAEPSLRTPLDEIVACLTEIGITHIKRHSEHFVAEYCDDCGAPLFADPTGDLVHAEMPEDAPVGTEHFH